jgi:hypothetical protein
MEGFNRLTVERSNLDEVNQLSYTAFNHDEFVENLKTELQCRSQFYVCEDPPMNPSVADEEGDVDANQARLYREWRRDNSGAMGRIKKSFGNIKRRELTAADVTDAFSMWAKVQTFKLDGAQSMTRIYQAQWEKCGWNFKNESAMQFFSKLDTIQIAMDNAAGDERISDIKYIHKVMMSLPKNWTAFVAAYEVSDADIENCQS